MFEEAFQNQPVVLNTALADPNNLPTDATDDAIDSDPSSVTLNGFNVRLQEEQASNGLHGPETVGWIAIEVGGDGDFGSAITHENFDESTVTYGLGATYEDAIVVGETQTLNDTEAANIEIRSNLADPVNNSITNAIALRLREEQSADNETNHDDETLGIAAFERGIITCFTPGTQIDTPEGSRSVETLEVGDLVTTRDHGPQLIRFVAKRRLGSDSLAAAPHLRPVLIRKDALGDNLPDADLKVSPQHRMLIEGAGLQALTGEASALATAKSLTNGRMIRVAEGARSVEYIHILFDRHEIIFANGAATESLHPGGCVVNGLEQAARQKLFEIFPDLARRPNLARGAPRPQAIRSAADLAPAR